MGRPLKAGEDIVQYIQIRTLEERRLSADALSAEIENKFSTSISATTINRIRGQLELKFKPPLRSVFLTDAAKERRIQWCQLQRLSNTDWRKVIFSDESYFALGANNHWVWRRPEDIGEDVRAPKQLHPEKILIWGAIGFNFKSKLILVEGTINAKSYIDDIIVASDFANEANQAFPGGYIFQQDNARPHTAATTMEKLSELGINVLPQWPPYSPDLNVIELVWAIMKRRVAAECPKSLTELKIILHRVWDNLAFHTIEQLIDSMPRRLQYVIQNNGLTVHKRI